MSLPTGFSFDLSGRTVLVTGASSGIGRRFAHILAGSGANVVLGARRLEMLKQLQLEIQDAGGRALALPLDTSDESSVSAAFEAAEAKFGAVDSVIANAGTSAPGNPLTMPVDDFDRVIAVNLRGVFLTVREGARRMIANDAAKRNHGRIVIISSVTAQRAYSGLAVYAASKAAISQLGRVLAKDWARKGVNVNIIEPGYMSTELTQALWENERGRQLLAEFPRARIMNANALDVMLLYLSSDASAQVTGSVFTIDDGQTL